MPVVGHGAKPINVPKEEIESSEIHTTTESGKNVKINTNIKNLGIEDIDNFVYDTDFNEINTMYYNKHNIDVKSFMTNMTTGIFGLPYQFSENIDVPIEGTDFGRMYSEKIVSIMPIMFICPGEPVFMMGQSNRKKQGVLNLLGNIEASGDFDIKSITEDGKEGRYYSFNSTFKECSYYINTSVRALATFMGIRDKKYINGKGKKCSFKNFRIEDITNPKFKSITNSDTSLAYYLDSETSISENFSNDSTESMLSSKVNTYSDTAREIAFILGSQDAGRLYDTIKNVSTGPIEIADSITKALPGGLGSGFLHNIASSLTTVLTGGKIVFPEIWSSSSYSKSYSINIKLRSPDPDPVSVMMNIYIVIITLISMAAPRQLDHRANSYKAPHLVRATYKSVFNCDLGLISGLDITYGGEGRWNSMHMPTSADVSITIKDLYSTMFISRDKSGLVNNTAQLDWLALRAGIDMNKAEYLRNKKLSILLGISEITNIPKNIWMGFKESLNKKINRFLNRTIGSDTIFLD